MSEWYLAPVDQLSQGDILADCPSIYLRPPLENLRPVTCAGGTQHYEAQPAGPGLFRNDIFTLASRARFAYGVVMTHSCELDKDESYRLLALVRPLPPDTDASVVAEITSNERKRFFHLPRETEHHDLPESYVDFRCITTLRGSVIDLIPRVLSMQEHLVASMSEAFIAYITRAVP